MADTKITALTALTVPRQSDELAIADNSGTPASKRITVANLLQDAARKPIMPTGWLAESLDRAGGLGNSNVLVDAQLYMQAIWLPKGLSITNIVVASGTTAMVAGVNQWFALFDSSRVKLAITADDTSTAWAASTLKALAITGGPYVTTTSGLYYIGVLVNITTTLPSMFRQNAGATITAWPPILCGQSDAGLTNPASCPSTAAAITAGASAIYCGVS